MSSATHSGIQKEPSGLQQAKEKFTQGVAKTRAAPDDDHAKGATLPGSKMADNPKTAGNFVSKLATGDTEGSHYDPAHYGGNGKG
ncbi:hypothetical protein GGR56DRAFT_669626 [Xylariaceae sp. FL0804]|nr:hypothetical protein GGR56DRAFT_669626 [Xylariaceae sp. FL0804]